MNKMQFCDEMMKMFPGRNLDVIVQEVREGMDCLTCKHYTVAQGQEPCKSCFRDGDADGDKWEHKNL